jgi:hypothetical protein
MTEQPTDPIWALFVYTVVASIVFTVSYFSTRNARRAAFHAGIGIVAFAALAYLGGLPKHWAEHWIYKHLVAFDVIIVFLAVVVCLVLKFTVTAAPLRWWQTLLFASLLFLFPALIGGVLGDITFAAARKFGWPAIRLALVFAVGGAVATFWLYGRREQKRHNSSEAHP